MQDCDVCTHCTKPDCAITLISRYKGVQTNEEGGQGSRLYALTRDMAKPGIPFGGKYRIIDFPLSNCINSGIDTVGVLTQYKPLQLNSYIGSGSAWDLDASGGGAFILPPYQTKYVNHKKDKDKPDTQIKAKDNIKRIQPLTIIQRSDNHRRND